MVDDSPTIQKVVSVTLEAHGHEVVTASDGMEALAKLRTLRPDLVLLDITMPHMDGYQLCRILRSNELTKQVPIVMLSGKDGLFDKMRGRMAGAATYITKPFAPSALPPLVEEDIASGRSGDVASARRAEKSRSNARLAGSSAADTGMSGARARDEEFGLSERQRVGSAGARVRAGATYVQPHHPRGR